MDFTNTTATATASNFEQAETGMHQAVCVFIHNIGTQRGEYQGKPIMRKQVVISWELDQKLTTGDYAGKPFMVSKFYTLSLNEKSSLLKDLVSWRGKPFTPEELAGFELKKLIGANCFLNLVETENGKRKIAAIMPIKKEMDKLTPTMSEPSENFMAFIDKFRAQSEEMKQKAADPTHTADPDNNDGLPF